MLNDDDLDEEEVGENNSVDMNMMKAMIGLDIHDSDQRSNHNNSNDSDDVVKLHNILSKHNAVYDLNNPSSKVIDCIDDNHGFVKQFHSFTLLSNCLLLPFNSANESLKWSNVF